MEPDDLNDRLRRHEEMIEGLAKVWMRQSEMNERMDGALARLNAFIEEQRGMHERMDSYLARQDRINERLTAAIERLDATQADIKTLLTRLLRGSGNGRDA
jgi:hypothetical protein